MGLCLLYFRLLFSCSCLPSFLRRRVNVSNIGAGEECVERKVGDWLHLLRIKGPLQLEKHLGHRICSHGDSDCRSTVFVMWAWRCAEGLCFEWAFDVFNTDYQTLRRFGSRTIIYFSAISLGDLGLATLRRRALIIFRMTLLITFKKIIASCLSGTAFHPERKTRSLIHGSATKSTNMVDLT